MADVLVAGASGGREVALAQLMEASYGVNRVEISSDIRAGLDMSHVSFRNVGSHALTVCLAAEGYPDSPKKGESINGLDVDYDGVSVQLAGVKHHSESQAVATNGGRVLYVTAVGDDIDDAALKAYSAIAGSESNSSVGVGFEGAQYRKDIGHQARKGF